MAGQKTERELLEQINEKMGQLVGLLAVQGLSDDRKIAVLSRLGFNSEFIGKLVGITPGAVRAAKSRRLHTKKELKAKP